MLTEEQRQEIYKKQAQFLVDNQKAEDELDAMIAEGERLDALAEKAKK
jgi:KaiC/GvpD/RAD55 family RecA-like ATPase